MSNMTLEELRDELENGCVEYIDRQDAVIAIDCAISQLAEIHAALYQANQKNDTLLRERESVKPVAWLDMGKGEAQLVFSKKGDSNRASGKHAVHLFKTVEEGYHPLYLHPPMLASARVPDDVSQDAARYRWLRMRPGQIGTLIWPHAPWIHEDYTENQARLDLCIDEERVDALAAAPKPATEG